MDTFLKAIEANPNDTAAKLLFADWLEERGDESLALAFRVAAERGWHPLLAGSQYVWWTAREYAIPPRMIPDMPYSFQLNQSDWSLLDAFRRLAKALEKVGVTT